MYRVIFFLAFVAYCSSFSFSGSNVPKSFNKGFKDDADVVDNDGAGYSYFRKQDIETRPSMRPSAAILNQDQDISEYRHSSALDSRPTKSQIISTNNNQLFNKGFGQQQLFANSDFEAQPWIAKSAPFQQTATTFQQDRSPMFRDFRGEQSNLLNQNAFSNQAQDIQPIGSQQILLRPSTLNIQHNTLNAQRNQQQLNDIAQQPTWNSQQQFTGFASSFNNKFQRPVTSSFDKEFVQQPVVKPPVITKFMAPQAPIRRVIAQSQSSPQMSTGGW